MQIISGRHMSDTAAYKGNTPESQGFQAISPAAGSSEAANPGPDGRNVEALLVGALQPRLVELLDKENVRSDRMG
jgi:hypothetical protein